MNINLGDLRWYLDNGGREALRSKGLEVSESGDVRPIPQALGRPRWDHLLSDDLAAYPREKKLSTGYAQGVRV